MASTPAASLALHRPPRVMPLLLLGLALAVSAPALAMRCNGQLIDEGDLLADVRETCGPPDYIATYPHVVVPALGYTDTLQHWYYNRGSERLLRRLTFRGNRLQLEETLGYGFVEPQWRCTVGELHEGMSEYELHARCGEPLSQREWHLIVPLGKGLYRGNRVIPVEERIYEFGPDRFRRTIRLENGLVARISTGDKPG